MIKQVQSDEGVHARGFTIVELLMVVGLIGILMGMLLPAVQSVREVARRASCQNNLRQLTLATHHFESSNRILPGPWFNSMPDRPDYSSDRGLFVALLPFLEGSNLEFVEEETGFSTENGGQLSSRLPMLSCPSAVPGIRLHDIAESFSGPATYGHSTHTCDYMGNGGHTINADTIEFSQREGPVGIQVPGLGTHHVKFADIQDGTSTTLLYWESIGAVLKFPTADTLFNSNESATDSFNILLDDHRGLYLASTGTASTKSYLLSWAGLRIGNVNEFNGGSINIGNDRGQPFSSHPGGCNFARLDGSVQFLRQSISPDVLAALCSMAGDEVVPEIN